MQRISFDVMYFNWLLVSFLNRVSHNDFLFTIY